MKSVLRFGREALKATALGTLVLVGILGMSAAEDAVHPQHSVTVQSKGLGDPNSDDPTPWG